MVILTAVFVAAVALALWGWRVSKKNSLEPPRPQSSHIDTTSFLDDVPEKVRDRVVLLDGVLHISEEITGDLDMEFLVSRLRSRRNILSYEIHKPSEFEEQYARKAIRRVSGDNEVQQMAIALIARAYENGASDIHLVNIGTFVLVKFRRKGAVCEDSEIGIDLGTRMIRVIYDKLGQSTNSASFTTLERLDGRIVNRTYLPEGVHSVRIHCEPIECAQASTGTYMALRLLYDSTAATGTVMQRLEVLGFPDEQRVALDNLTRRKGLIFVSGPTGHGKSTALKHIMESMAEYQPEKCYLAVEDPPEYPLRGVYQIQVNTKAISTGVYGSLEERAAAYREAIAGAMRSDLDVCMIGEVRYPEAALAAIMMAQTGHAVWATVHASSAFGIVDRLETMLRSSGMRDPLSMLCSSNVLAGLEYQCLVPKLCSNCKLPLMDFWSDPEKLSRVIPPAVAASMSRVMNPHELRGVYVRGEGCKHCDKDGFTREQTVVAEVVTLDTELLALLRNGSVVDAIKIWQKQRNGVSYVEQARRLIAAGELDPARAASRLGVDLDCDTYNDWGSI